MFTVILLLVLSAAQASVHTHPLELFVEGAGSRGTLVFTSEAATFKAAKAGKSKTWLYQDLRQIRIESPKKISLGTFESRNGGRLGIVRAEGFKMTSGEITGETVAFLLAHVARPVATSILPANLGDAVTRVPVRHRRYRHASQGTLAVHATGLAYVADRQTDSRFWRFVDLQSVLRTSPFELLVTACEGDTLQTYAFDLKELFPQDAFDALWAQVNPARPRVGGTQ